MIINRQALGLLIGAERERRKLAGPMRGAAGIRTFAVATLLGALALLVGGLTRYSKDRLATLDLNFSERDQSPAINSTTSPPRNWSRIGKTTVSDVARASAISGAVAEPLSNT